MMTENWYMLTRKQLKVSIENLWAEECAYGTLKETWYDIANGNGDEAFLTSAMEQGDHYEQLEHSIHERRQRAIAVLNNRTLKLDKWGRIET